MASTTGELILSHERLRLQQQQLQQTSQRLRNLTRQLDPLREEVQTIYDQLSIAGTSSPSLVNSIHSPLQATNRDQNGTTPIPETVNSLGLAQYSDIHSSLQQFQELMVQVQEARADIDLIARDLHEDLDQTQRHLDGLYDEITQARLVPFRTLAQRFPKQLHHLSLQYGKSVAVVLEGEEVLVDQVLLERLQTPLTHLLNNAFDHGIELPRSRQDQGKPEQATIHLSATIDNNTLVVRVTDDGQGINLGKVYAKAQHQGLCDPQRTFESFQTDEILDWIFQPRFSTADTVSVLSGRGVGLDIVREQVRRLRGTIQVSTQPHQGTTFTLRLPLSLSWLSLLLCQFQNYAVAIPSTSILETLPYNELDWLDTPTPRANWRQQSAQVTSLSSLLFPTLGGMESETPRVAIVLEGNNGPLIVSVDTLLGERQLILKPLDDTVTPPPYLVGCTILGSGQVVPVILPQAFETMPTLEPGTPPPPETPQTQIPTIMVVEDSVATRQMLERLLSEVGLQVVVCRDGKEALQALSQRRGQVDLVISDVEMPKVNGFELLQRIRSQADWSQIPVVMATSKTSPEYQQRAMDLGATGYLGKPIQPQQLFDVIQQTLSSGIE
jgi:chemotaxis protein histidine kinase CheA/ActR/RegA family two-component response regulator